MGLYAGERRALYGCFPTYSNPRKLHGKKHKNTHLIHTYTCVLVTVTSWLYFQVLNLFLALLLNAFATDGLKSDEKTEKEDSKMTRGWHMLKRLFKKKKPVCINCDVTSVNKHGLLTII